MNYPVVYFVRAGDEGGPIKIGYTTNLTSRMNAISTHNPQDLLVLAVQRATPTLERMLHSKFARDNIRGEWFHSSQALLDYIAQIGPYEAPPAEQRFFRKRICKEPSVTCSKCGMGFDDLYYFMRHAERAHKRMKRVYALFDGDATSVAEPDPTPPRYIHPLEGVGI